MGRDLTAKWLVGTGQRGWWFIKAVGGLHIVVFLWYLLGVQPRSLSAAFALELLLGLIGPLGLLYLGSREVTRSTDQTYAQTAISRFIVGYLGFGLIAGLLLLNRILKGYVVESPFPILYLATTTGGLAGLLIGIKEVEIRNRIEQLEESRDSFAFLNSLLRHNVLNSIQIIDGYATMLDQQRSKTNETEAIRKQSAVIKETIQNVRVMTEALSTTVQFESIDIVPILEEQVDRSRSVYDATFEIDLPEHTVIRADPLIAAVIQNLLDNAVTHNDAAQPMVTITVNTTDEVVIIEIADNGPGIADDRKERIFTRENSQGDQGLGLYLVKTLIERYDGTITIEDNDPRGAVFICRLPRDGTDGTPTSTEDVPWVSPARELDE